jgi:hypothetical protein
LAILFVVGTATELAGNRGKITLDAVHGLGVDMVEEVVNTAKETTCRFMKAPPAPALGSCFLGRIPRTGRGTSSGVREGTGSKRNYSRDK